MKCYETILVLLLCLFWDVSPLRFSSKLDLSNFKYSISSNFTLPEGPIYAQGWLKYLTYEKHEKNKPTDFLKNMAFYQQMSDGETMDLSKSDGIGFVNIPDEDHFFFILTENSLNVLSSRENNLAKTVDILNLDEIQKLPNSSFSGGIEDHGDFTEGYCFKINFQSTKNNKTENVWELCADTREQKLNWMNTIFKLVGKDKKSSVEIAEENNFKNMISSIRRGISKETLEEIKSNKKVTWVPITTWSECSKPCGGGKSYLQRLCVLPSNSKEKCVGERILSKDCNLQPCENTVTETELLKLQGRNKSSKSDNSTGLNHPVFKFMPVSRRPLRYERCTIKEGDLAIYIEEGSIKGSKIPVRVILNNRTLTAYSNDDYESIIVSHSLSKITGLRKFEKEKTNTCFTVEEGQRKTTLCAFVSPRKSLKDLAVEWQNDILDFIKNCAEFYSHELDFKSMNEMSLDKVQTSLDFYGEKEKDQMEHVILKTQQLALQAIEKELKVENLIEKEEELKQKKLEEQVNSEFEKIKKQKDLINQALQEKKKQADVYASKLMIKKKIKQISQQVQREVIKIREDLKARILSKQRDEKRKRELIQNKINSLKSDISKNLLKASKNGDSQECNPERPAEEIVEYCKVNYELDNNKMNECVMNDNFCYMCCESEFGDLHLESRSVCYTKCDDFYIYKVKFGGENPIKLKIEVTPNGVKRESIVEESKSKENAQLRTQSQVQTKFLETKTTLENKNTSFYQMNDYSKIIEEEKKKQLLLDIKADLNF